ILLHTMGVFYGKRRNIQWEPYPSVYMDFENASIARPELRNSGYMGFYMPHTPVTEPVVRVENLSIALPVTPPMELVSNISFSIDKGDYFALVGESGSGKS